MANLAIESLICGVDDLERCKRCWDDFGLTPLSRTAQESVFEAASGSRVVNRRRGDLRLAAAFSDRVDLHETIGGVDSTEVVGGARAACPGFQTQLAAVGTPHRAPVRRRYHSLGCATRSTRRVGGRGRNGREQK